uniref:Uncharacterized protein n=1 Tax=Anguilla anguilla TaxID=7936 RepID=A0A0E9XS60_ANGAN
MSPPIGTSLLSYLFTYWIKEDTLLLCFPNTNYLFLNFYILWYNKGKMKKMKNHYPLKTVKSK